MKTVIRNLWRLVYPLIVYFAVALAVEFGFLFIYSAVQTARLGTAVSQEQLESAIKNSTLYITSLINLVLIPCYIFFIKKDNNNRIQSGGVKYRLPEMKQWIIITVLGVCAAISANGLVTFSGIANFSPKYKEVSEAVYTGNILLEIVTAAIIAPALEELLFRGLIYRRIRENLSVFWSVIISAAFFGAFHGNLVQFVYAFIVGAMMAYVVEKYKTVWAAVVFHMGANLISILITEILPEKYFTVINVLAATFITLAVTIILLKYVSRYEVKDE